MTTPPFYIIPNLSNFRDPALLPLSTSSGSPIRCGILFRSADVSQLDSSGWLAVRKLGVSQVFDLRSGPELDKNHGHNINQGASNEQEEEEGSRQSGSTGQSQDQSNNNLGTPSSSHPEWQLSMQKAGIKRHWVPVFQSADYSPERLAERYMCYMDSDTDGFVRAYEDILRNAGGAFRSILLYLAQLESPSPVSKEEEQETTKPLGALIHCSAGKDRTGIFFGLLFDFLSVPREKIAEEYNLTELGLVGRQSTIVPRLMQSNAFKEYMRRLVDGGGDKSQLGGGGGNKSQKDTDTNTPNKDEDTFPPEILEQGKQAALRMVGARKESMLGALDMLDRVFGGAEAYMRKECGLGDAELEALRRNLVVGVEGEMNDRGKDKKMGSL